MAARSYMGIPPTTGTTHGTEATMAPARPPTARTGPQRLEMHITRRPEPTHGAPRPSPHTARKKQVKPTTQTREPMPRPIRHPMHMGATGTRSIPRTAKPPPRSMKATRMGPLQRCKVRMGPRLLLGPPPAVNITPRANPQVAPSTRNKTATSTRTRGAGGNKPSQNRITTPKATQPLPKVGDSRRRAADHQPLAEAQTVGNPGRRVLVVRIVAAAVEVGVAGNSRK